MLAAHGAAVARSPHPPAATVAGAAQVLLSDEEAPPARALQPLGLDDLRSAVAAASGRPHPEGRSRATVFKIGDRSSLGDNPGVQAGSFNSNLPDRTPTPRLPEGFSDLGGGRITVDQSGRQ